MPRDGTDYSREYHPPSTEEEGEANSRPGQKAWAGPTPHQLLRPGGPVWRADPASTIHTVNVPGRGAGRDEGAVSMGGPVSGLTKMF